MNLSNLGTYSWDDLIKHNSTREHTYANYSGYPITIESDPIEQSITFTSYGRPSEKIVIIPEIEHIYADEKNGVIVVKWSDNTEKTIVKLKDGDIWDLEAGVNAAIVKKIYSESHTSYQKLISTHTTYVQHKKPKKKAKNG